LKVDYDSIKPIYLQIAEAIEDDILTGQLSEGGPAYSQLTLSKELGVNPATAAKGINVLVQEGMLEKKRGQSMTVTVGAKKRLLALRQKGGLQPLIRSLVTEARKMELSEEEVLGMLHDCFRMNSRGEGGNG